MYIITTETLGMIHGYTKKEGYCLHRCDKMIKTRKGYRYHWNLLVHGFKRETYPIRKYEHYWLTKKGAEKQKTRAEERWNSFTKQRNFIVIHIDDYIKRQKIINKLDRI